jgi:hypothetical protein
MRWSENMFTQLPHFFFSFYYVTFFLSTETKNLPVLWPRILKLFAAASLTLNPSHSHVKEILLLKHFNIQQVERTHGQL